MQRYDVPVDWRHIAAMAPTVLIPVGLGAYKMWLPATADQSRWYQALSCGLFVLIAIALLAALVAMARRHVLELGADALVVRHSVYTLTVPRGAVTAITVQPVTTSAQLGLALRTNGIHLFGYHSGWYRGNQHQRIFCAVSQWPVYLVTFEGEVACRQLAVSASPQAAAHLAAWPGQSSAPGPAPASGTE